VTQPGVVGWPRGAFEPPALRGLDERGRSEIARAGAIVDFADGALVCGEKAYGDCFFVVIAGEVELSTSEAERTFRRARRGETFGEDAALPGGLRRSTARARGATRLARIPLGVFVRAAERSGSNALAERELGRLRRAGTRDLVRGLPGLSDLGAVDLEVLLDAARPHTFERGSRLFSAGDRATEAFLIVDGVVQVEREDAERISVQGYLTRGDLAGDEAVLHGDVHAQTAIAQGRTECLAVPSNVLRTLADRAPAAFARRGRVALERRAEQQEVLADVGSTQHAFRDLYRMQMARALLAIDQETCVRCGHCAWACEQVHGVARLVRRGDKLVTRLDTEAPSSLLLPNTCQHCRNPVCMPDCPTGAIGRDADGEVFIVENLCTGCGACAKACPWENIQMAPRLAAKARASVDVAVKCDLCREFEAPACVQGCPTESILRLEPTRDFAEVERMLGGRAGDRSHSAGARARSRPEAPLTFGLAGAALLAVGFAGRLSGAWSPPPGTSLGVGVLGALGVVVAALYAVPKRKVSLWMKRRARRGFAAQPGERTGLVRSKVRRHLNAHLAVGVVAMLCVLAHGKLRFDANLAGALDLSFWLTAALGVLGALAYASVPQRLARIERQGQLPEDFAAERALLIDRLYDEASGKSDLVKKIVERVLVPYARSFLAPWKLVASGRSLHDEEVRVRARITRLLAGRGAGRLAGLDDLVRTVVEHRALPARRWLTRALGGWLILHVVATATTLALLVLHVASVVK
jgi:Fe-S-cluster-containing dehydrogenase component/CRP-like cAMP-binding protein